MNAFEQKLLRLKQALGLSSDQDVANALGLSKAAFSDRKKRNAFPDDKLYALAAKEPALQLDVLGIISGDKKDVLTALALAQLEAAMKIEADHGGTLVEQLKRAHAVVEQMNKPVLADAGVTALIQAMPLREDTRELLAALVTGDARTDGPLIARAIACEAQGNYFVSGEPAAAEQASATSSARAVSEGDRVLLDNFHAAPAQVQAGIKTALGAFTPESAAVKSRKRAA